MLQNAKVTATTVSELLKENQQGDYYTVCVGNVLYLYLSQNCWS